MKESLIKCGSECPDVWTCGEQLGLWGGGWQFGDQEGDFVECGWGLEVTGGFSCEWRMVGITLEGCGWGLGIGVGLGKLSWADLMVDRISVVGGA